MAATVRAVIAALLLAAPLNAQTSATLQGRVFDESGALIPGATITVRSESTGFNQVDSTDAEGRYAFTAMPPGGYEITAAATEFRSETVAQLTLEVGRTIVHDFRLDVGDTAETVVVAADALLVDRASSIVGHVVTATTIQGIPLNGSHFTDLGLLVPGSVAPSQAGFATRPIRGLGALAINTAGNREEAVGFVINGVTSNNLTFGSLMFEPPLGSVQEFKVDNSVFSAEYGHVSGAIVNIVSRSGTDEVHGDLFGLLRNDALDARNFFEFTSPEPHRFERSQFGGSLGGPMVRGRSFLLATYDGFRQRQGLDMNSLVFSDEQRAMATDPAVRRLLELIPRPNLVDASGASRFVGSAAAVADHDRWTVDVRHAFTASARLHGFHGGQYARLVEPGIQGTTIPGFGSRSRPLRSLVTVDETQTFGSALVNEARFGRSALRGGSFVRAELNPADYGIQNGVTRGIGLPMMNVAGGLIFGGPANYPSGRYDASYVLNDTASYTRGRHMVRFGGEYRRFLNENFAEGTGSYNFPSISAFLSGTANAFAITLGNRVNHIDQRALASFFQDRIAVGSRVTVDLGLRYEWHVTPTEHDDQFVVFDAESISLRRVGVDLDEIYRQNNRNLEPRLGVAWDAWRDGRTIVRAAYGRSADEPGTTVVRETAGNPPFATPLAATGAIPLATSLSVTRSEGLAPATVDPRFRNASLQSWNVNVQHQLAWDLAAMAGYFGSRGKDLRITRNINQPVNGVRPFGSLSSTSPILPNSPLGNIMQVESSGFSRYNAVWLSLTKRQSRGVQFDASYTWSKSLDTNSLNSSGFAVQDSYDIARQYGLSDFDARHRFIVSVTYSLPFTGHVLTQGWQLAAIVQSQSGNPVNIVTSNSLLNGMPNSIRPDLTGPIRIIGSVDQWFDTSVFAATDRFGNLGRNVVIGPGFHNTDLSLSKNLTTAPGINVQLRADVFDLFNHPNFGPPGNIVGSPTFGRITRTRFSTGEGGSSRQMQLGLKVSF